MSKKDLQNKVEEFLTDLFEKLTVKAEVKSEFAQDETKLEVQIDSEDANLLIGYHGDTLNSIQHLVNAMVFNSFGEGTMVIVDVSGYRKEREQKLIEIAENASSKAKFLQKSVALYPMNSFERRIVHAKVSEIEGVSSHSEGEGYNRRIIIVPE